MEIFLGVFCHRIELGLGSRQCVLVTRPGDPVLGLFRIPLFLVPKN